MENFISGTDKRDLVEIIDPEGAAEYRGNKDRRCTCHSTGDSGFSGSVQPDDVEETRRIFDGKSYFALLVIGLETDLSSVYLHINLMKKYNPHKAFPITHAAIEPRTWHVHSCALRARTGRDRVFVIVGKFIMRMKT